MSQRIYDDFLYADRFSLDYLIAECIWNPAGSKLGKSGKIQLRLVRFPFSG
jgi:hypothetical protein